MSNLVKVTGEDAPSFFLKGSADTSFSSAGLSPLLKYQFGHNEPTLVQKHCLSIIMARRDLMCCAPTGSGKTAAYLLPILHKLIEARADCHAGAETQTPQCVVITPSKELAIQIKVECGLLAGYSLVKYVSLYETLPSDKNYEICQLKKGCNILICTPERMICMLDKGQLSFRNLKYLVFDEAHRILGMPLMPDIQRRIKNLTIAGTMPPKGDRQTLIFSSSLPDEIQLAAQEFLCDNYLFVTVAVGNGPIEEDRDHSTKTSMSMGCLKRKREVQEEEVEDIKGSIRKNFIANIQTANSKLAAKEKEFSLNEEKRQREVRQINESQESDIRKIDMKFEKEINELEKIQTEQEQKLAITETRMAEIKQRKQNEKEKVLETKLDEMRILNAKLRKENEYEKDMLVRLKQLADQLARNLKDLDLQPINKERSTEKAKLDAAISTLKCPVCWETMKPPTKIWMCAASHIVCEPCKVTLAGRACPTCRVKWVTLRAYMAEEFARSVFSN